jgi:hypothetical protein
MANWKKVIVSGSNVSQLNNDAGYITSATLATPNAFSTASFSGTNLLANSPSGALNFASSSTQGLTITADAGTDTLTFGLAAIPNTSLANSTISGVSLGGTLAALTAGSGLESGGTYTGNTARTFSVATGSTHFIDGARKTISVADTTGASGIDLTYNATTGILSGSLVNSSITIAGTSVSLGGSITQATILAGSGVFSGSAQLPAGLVSGSAQVISLLPAGTVSGSSQISFGGITGVPSGLVSGSSQITYSGISGIPANIVSASVLSSPAQGEARLTINGVAGSIIDLGLQTTDNPSFAGVTAGNITVGVTTDNTIGATGDLTIDTSGNTVTINDNLIVTNNLTVQGTASFQQTTNLEVADRFILLASGSNTTGDGGLVVQQGTQNIGELFGYDSGVLRWGVTGSFTANQSNYTPDAFMAAVSILASTNPNTSGPATRYNANGNIYVSSGDESIWIYS